MRKRQGFTLVELLVVIAIIALLMAILMPALSRVKKQAKSAACKVTLHQWSLIWGLYCEDNDNKFCYGTPATGSGTGWARGLWIIALRSQWETRTDILRCPMAMKRRLDGKAWGDTFNTYIMGTTSGTSLQEDCSYGANCWLYNPRPKDITRGHIQNRDVDWNWRTPDVSGGNRIPVFADTMWRGGGPYDLGTGGNPPAHDGEWDGYNKEMKHFCINRHEGRVNHLFLDWSVRSVDLKELWTLKWHRQYNTAGYWTRAGGVAPRDWPEWMRNFKEY